MDINDGLLDSRFIVVDNGKYWLKFVVQAQGYAIVVTDLITVWRQDNLDEHRILEQFKSWNKGMAQESSALAVSEKLLRYLKLNGTNPKVVYVDRITPEHLHLCLKVPFSFISFHWKFECVAFPPSESALLIKQLLVEPLLVVAHQLDHQMRVLYQLARLAPVPKRGKRLPEQPEEWVASQSRPTAPAFGLPPLAQEVLCPHAPPALPDANSVASMGEEAPTASVEVVEQGLGFNDEALPKQPVGSSSSALEKSDDIFSLSLMAPGSASLEPPPHEEQVVAPPKAKKPKKMAKRNFFV